MAETWETTKTPVSRLVSKIVDDADDEDEYESSDEEEVQIVSSEDTDLVEIESPAPATPSGSSSEASATVKFLLDSLHKPTASELSRKQKIDRNQPPKGKKRSRGSFSSDPKSITPQQRVRQHPDQCFSVSKNMLFCLACREELSVKSSVITGHVKSSKHKTGKSRLEAKKKQDMEIVEAEGSDTYRNLVQDARKSEESLHKSGISITNHYKS